MTRPGVLAAALVAVAVPLMLLGNALVLTAQPWIVHAQYRLPGFPDSRLGLSRSERADLGVAGVRAIAPWHASGPDDLRASRLLSGAGAFDARELSHMDDVREGVVLRFVVAWGLAIAVIVLAGAALHRRGPPGALRAALHRGARWTIVAFTGLGLLMVIAFPVFFDGFHGLFFESGSWRFSRDDTLRDLYPDAFWGTAAGVMAALILVQALALLLLTRGPLSRFARAGSPPRTAPAQPPAGGRS